MPNWCSTTYHFEGDEKDIKVLKKSIRDYQAYFKDHINDKNIIYCNVAMFIDYCKDKNLFNKSEKDYKCRGGIAYMDYSESNILELVIDDAWYPHPDFWFDLIEYNHWNIEISYIAEEPGCEVYQKHGTRYEEKYYLDDETGLLNGGNSYFITDKDLVKTVKKQIKNYLQSVDNNNIFDKNIKITTIEDIYTFIEKFNEEYPDVYLSLHEFEEV